MRLGWGCQFLLFSLQLTPKTLRKLQKHMTHKRHIRPPFCTQAISLQFSICPLIPEPTLIQRDVDLKSTNVVTCSMKAFAFQLAYKKKQKKSEKEKSLSEDVSTASQRISTHFSSRRKISCGGLEPRGATKQNLMSHSEKHSLEHTIPFPTI